MLDNGKLERGPGLSMFMDERCALEGLAVEDLYNLFGVLKIHETIKTGVKSGVYLRALELNKTKAWNKAVRCQARPAGRR